jgi:hypothetical protein
LVSCRAGRWDPVPNIIDRFMAAVLRTKAVGRHLGHRKATAPQEIDDPNMADMPARILRWEKRFWG